jgi:LacI family transcriptional regulator
MSRINNKNNNIYKKKISIKDIAKIANVSVATVSRSLRRDPATKLETAEKVIKIARELDYFPDSFAKGLREKRTNTIGVILNDINNPFYAEVLSSIHSVLVQSEYSMIVSYSDWDFSQERTNIKSMLSKRVDGIIMSPVDDKSENINLIIKNNIPFVLFDSYPYFKNVNYVYVNHKKASILATNYLIENGHKNILLIIMPYENLLSKNFLDGYLETLVQNDIKVKDELIIKAPGINIESGYKIFSNIITNNLKSKTKLNFSSVIAMGDLIAAGIYKAANELGFKIPEDYSIIGYDNIELTSVLTPPLTTIHQPRKRIGRDSTNILLNEIKYETKDSFTQRIFEPDIIIRKSVKKIN